MIWIIVLFVALFALPFVEVVHFLRFNLSTPIHIPSDRTKDPRFFAKSFRKKFNSAWHPGMKSVFLSKIDRVITPQDITDYTKPCDAVVISLGDFNLTQAEAVFNKEILVKGKADFKGALQFRSLAVDETLVLGYGVKIIRWVDALSTIYVKDHCDLGLSSSSNERLCIGRNVRFKRLYAPIMELGKSRQGLQKFPAHPKLEEAMQMVPSELRQSSLNEMQPKGDFVHASIITTKDLEVPAYTSINGHLRVYGDVSLGEQVLVSGNIFVDGNFSVERGCVLLGNIFVRGDIVLHDNVVLGQPYHPISLVGIKGIQIGLNVIAHGYLHSGSGGVIYPETISEQVLKELRVQDEIEPYECTTIEVKSPNFVIEDELKHTHPLGLRTLEYVDNVVIPEGVTTIRRSFFYRCENLKQITLPSTLKHIEAFAFYGCESLEWVNLSQCSQLERIDEFAFANCSNLQQLTLPSSIMRLGPAVFMECKSLRILRFSETTLLNIIPEHFCMDCVALVDVVLPPLTSMIETSAFRNCTNLLSLGIPSQVRRIDNYAFEGIEKIQLEIKQIDQKDVLFTDPQPTNISFVVSNTEVE